MSEDQNANPGTTDSMKELRARKLALDTLIEQEKEQTGDVTLATALAWWDVATTIRDLTYGKH